MTKFFEKEKPKSPRRRSPPRRRRSANDAFTSTESPYLAYYMDRFHVVREEKPDVPVTQLSTIIAKEWNSLSDEKKHKYCQDAKNAKDKRLSVSFFTKESELEDNSSKNVKTQDEKSGEKKEKNTKGKSETVNSSDNKDKGDVVTEASIPSTPEKVSAPPSSDEVSVPLPSEGGSVPLPSEEVSTPPPSDPLPSEEISNDIPLTNEVSSETPTESSDTDFVDVKDETVEKEKEVTPKRGRVTKK